MAEKGHHCRKIGKLTATWRDNIILADTLLEDLYSNGPWNNPNSRVDKGLVYWRSLCQILLEHIYCRDIWSLAYSITATRVIIWINLPPLSVWCSVMRRACTSSQWVFKTPKLSYTYKFQHWYFLVPCTQLLCLVSIFL